MRRVGNRCGGESCRSRRQLPIGKSGVWRVAPCSDPGGSRVRSGKNGGLRRSHVIAHAVGCGSFTPRLDHNLLFFLSPPPSKVPAASPSTCCVNAADALAPGRSENDSKTHPIRHAPPLHAGGFLPARAQAELRRPRETENGHRLVLGLRPIRSSLAGRPDPPLAPPLRVT